MLTMSGSNFPTVQRRFILDPFSVFPPFPFQFLNCYTSHAHSVPLLCLARHLLPSSGLEGLLEWPVDVKHSHGKRINNGKYLFLLPKWPDQITGLVRIFRPGEK